MKKRRIELRIALPGSAIRQTSCRRGRYWMSVLTISPSTWSESPGASAVSGARPRVVLVAQRQMQHEIRVARDPEPCQLISGAAARRLLQAARPYPRLAALLFTAWSITRMTSMPSI